MKTALEGQGVNEVPMVSTVPKATEAHQALEATQALTARKVAAVGTVGTVSEVLKVSKVTQVRLVRLAIWLSCQLKLLLGRKFELIWLNFCLNTVTTTRLAAKTATL